MNGVKNREDGPQTTKKPQKRWKNILTNGFLCGKIFKFAARRMTVPCKLNNAKTNKTPLTNLWICLKRKRKTANENSWVNCQKRLFRKWFEAWKRFRYNFLRVWSWLRTNAGGVPNTCKSNEALYSEIRQRILWLSGGRVSNVWATCLSVGDNSWKRLLIPHDA